MVTAEQCTNTCTEPFGSSCSSELEEVVGTAGGIEEVVGTAGGISRIVMTSASLQNGV